MAIPIAYMHSLYNLCDMEDYVTQKQIAKAINRHQTSVSRMISKLEGLITKEFGNVTVYHIESLPKSIKDKLKAQ